MAKHPLSHAQLSILMISYVCVCEGNRFGIVSTDVFRANINSIFFWTPLLLSRVEFVNDDEA